MSIHYWKELFLLNLNRQESFWGLGYSVLNLEVIKMVKISKKELPIVILSALILAVTLTIILYMRSGAQYSIAFLLISAGILIYLFNYYKNDKDVFNPDGVFSLIWLFCLGLSSLRLSERQYEWDLNVWIVLIFSWIFFLLGSKIPEFIILNNRGNFKINNKKTKKRFDLNKFRRSIIIIFFISFFSFVLEVIKAGFIPILSGDMSAYVNFGLPFIHYNTVSMSIVVILMFFYLLKNKSDRVVKSLFLIGMLQIVSISSRQLLIFTVTGFILVYHYTKRRFTLKKLSISIALMLVAFSVFGGIRNQSLDYLYHVAHIKPDVEKSFLMWPYLYFTMGFENMRNLLDNSVNYALGRYTLTPIWALTRIVTLFPSASQAPYNTIREFTVSTYLRDFYLDFGIAGVFFFPFLIGILTKHIYLKLKNNMHNKHIYLFMYIFALHNIAFAFFVNFYSNTSNMINIIYVVVIYYFSVNSYNSIEFKRLDGN